VLGEVLVATTCATTASTYRELLRQRRRSFEEFRSDGQSTYDPMLVPARDFSMELAVMLMTCWGEWGAGG
jgi:hypothetical protein